MINKKSRSTTKCIILSDCDILTHMPEECIWYIFGMNIMTSYIDIETSLNIIGWNICLFEIICCFSTTVGNGFIPWGNPTSLNLCDFLFVSCFFFQLPRHISNWLNCLYWLYIKITSLLSCGIVGNSVIWYIGALFCEITFIGRDII